MDENKENLFKFAENFQLQISTNTDTDESTDNLQEHRFTRVMIDHLYDAGEIEDATLCTHRAHGVQVNGYTVSEDEECLDLFISEFTGSVPPITITRTIVDIAFKRLTSFLKKSFDEYYLTLAKGSPIFDLAIRIHDIKNSLCRIRMFLLTDGIAKPGEITTNDLGGIPISYHVWDIDRLHRCCTSGKKREIIEIDFQSILEQPIPCLITHEANPDYTTYLSIFPASVLIYLYGEYGPRLLERNVRSYLQARGKVNAGIRQTIKNEPHMFLAYNNGISATAESIEIAESSQGILGIKSVKDFQIVNGAQTTASLYHAVRKDKADATQIQVQVKLTILKITAKMDEIVPRISECANSQNKIQTADFSANDPFHRKIEEWSRTIWAPATVSTQKQTRWYYERARGQYLDDKAREGTPAKIKAFEIAHLSSQKFTKTDLAKFENTWIQLPHIVSRGAQKNFQEFTVRLKERGGVVPDKTYFEHLIAKAIMFKTAEKIIQDQNYGGYRANIVTYTLARISHATAQRIDLDRIWREQGLSDALKDAIILLSKYAHTHITTPPNSANITEWCKKADCWKTFREKEILLPQALSCELLFLGKGAQTDIDKGIEGPDEKDQEIINEVMKIPEDTWFKISSWAKETNNLQGWQRGLAYSLGKCIGSSRRPSRKQALHGLSILKEAENLGFLSQ
jgi:hypothetical protein